MPRNRNSGSQSSPESRLAPEPEGPEEIYRRFERLNRRGGGRRLRDLVGGSGRKVLYGAFAIVEVAAIVLGLFLNVPFMDVVAIGLPGLLVMLHNGSKDEEQGGSEAAPKEGTILDRLLELLSDEEESGSADGSQTGRR